MMENDQFLCRYSVMRIVILLFSYRQLFLYFSIYKPSITLVLNLCVVATQDIYQIFPATFL
jgi:hypothetical protein